MLLPKKEKEKKKEKGKEKEKEKDREKGKDSRQVLCARLNVQAVSGPPDSGGPRPHTGATWLGLDPHPGCGA